MTETPAVTITAADRDLAALIMVIDQLPYEQRRDWLEKKLASHRQPYKPEHPNG